VRFSANLGFLWTDRPLPDAIRAAKAGGFDAVECHWPYAIPAAEVKVALDETGLPMLGLNTSRGNVAAGENGLSALPGREAEARAAIDDALAYAGATGARAVHVMAGYSGGPRAHASFCENLRYACERAGGITVLIEPLNHYDAPGYFLSTSAQAAAIIRELALPNLRLMFDCYHLQIMEGDLTRRLASLLPLVGHIQIAAVPDRGPPDHGELDYGHMLRHIQSLGWETPVGAEYRPGGDTDASLAWLARQRRERYTV
jgi:hydroxypyruvate isomerase